MSPADRDKWQIQAPLLLATTGAWVVLAARSTASGAASCCPVAQPSSIHSARALSNLIGREGLSTLAAGWLLMLAAMMGPMLAMPIGHIITRSFARRRVRAVLLFLLGYIAVWSAAGAILLTLALASTLYYPNAVLPALVAAAIMLVWQCSPLKQRCLNRGHAHTELKAFGIAADLDVLKFGVTHGAWCVGSCWALMLLPEVLPQAHFAAMAAVTLWFIAERLERPMTPRWRLPRFGSASRVICARTQRLLQRG